MNAQSRIPPYQAIDLMLGHHLDIEIPPVEGFVVTFPDNGLDCELLLPTEATPEYLEELKAKSKWPDHVFYQACWIHSQQRCFGAVFNRKYWTPR